MMLRKLAFLCVLMAAQAVWAQKWTISKIADNYTPCAPGGKGNFNPSDEFPAINGPWVAFLDVGDDKCGAKGGQSIWSYNLVTQKFVRLVDTDTEIPYPKGAGKFIAFSPIPFQISNLQVNNGTVVFFGVGNGHNTTDPNCSGGVYTVPVGGGIIHRVVDYTMKLPGQGGSFCFLNNDNGITGIQGMSLSQDKVVFSAQAVGNGYADDGVWWAPANVNTTEADLHLIADSTTVYQSPFPAGCHLPFCQTINGWAGGFVSGSNVAFTGGGGAGPYGLFLNSHSNPILLSNSVLPGDKNHDPHFPSEASFDFGPVIDGENVFFSAIDMAYKGTCGNGGGNAQGNFTGAFEMSLSGGPVVSLLNSCDRQPNGDRLNGPSSFLYLVANEGAAIFQVYDDKLGAVVLDSYVNGKVSKFVGPGDPLPTGAACTGKYHANNCVTGVSPPGTGGMNGGRVVFAASGGVNWYDEGVYLASLPCASSIGSDLTIDLGKPTYEAKSETWWQNVKIINKSKKAIPGPISLALSRVSGGTLVNRNGTTVCFASPGEAYVDFGLTGNTLEPGKGADLTLQFNGSAKADIKYKAEVAGAGAR